MYFSLLKNSTHIRISTNLYHDAMDALCISGGLLPLGQVAIRVHSRAADLRRWWLNVEEWPPFGTGQL